MTNLIHRNETRVPGRRVVADPLRLISGDVDSIFDRFFGETPTGRSPSRVATPRLDVTETETDYRVSAELPGVDEKDIELSVDDGVLVLKGERKVEEEDRARKAYRREQFYGRFHRAVTLPSEVDVEGTTAAFKNGILEVTLPKAEGSKPHKISVRAA